MPAPEISGRFLFDEPGAAPARAERSVSMPPSPFEQLLGAEFDRLPAPVRQVHAARTPLRTAGRADVTAATGAMAWFVSWFAGLPKPGRDIGSIGGVHPRR